MFYLLQFFGLCVGKVGETVLLRAALAGMLAFLISGVGTRILIRYCVRVQVGQSIRKEGPVAHCKKQGTPTMGGIPIMLALTVALLSVADLRSSVVWSVWLSTLAFACVGYIDDWAKYRQANSQGLSGKKKLLYQSIIAGLFLGFLTFYFYPVGIVFTSAISQFFMQVCGSLGGIALIWLGAWCIIVGTSNAVNLTDGLDGLAAFPIVITSLALAYLFFLSDSVPMPVAKEFFPSYSELSVFCAALAGAVLGFLWYNAAPALVFMGDVGSLACGGAIGMLGVYLQQEYVFLGIVFVFFLEALSVILQVGSFKLRKKRIFLMAPLHHHFELKGTPESRVVVRFWIISLITVLLALVLAHKGSHL